MKKIVFLLSMVLFLWGFSGLAQEMSLDEILSKYYQVTGLARMKDYKTLEYFGKSNMMGTEYPFRYFKKRPGKMRIEVEIQGSKMIQAYDGTNGWSVTPWSGSSAPQDMTADETKSMKDQADMEGSLYNWKEKGYKVELLGKDDMEGSPVYKIKLTKPEGDTEVFYIDADNFVVLKVSYTIKIQGNDTESEVNFSNYRPVNDILIPFSLQNKFKGANGEFSNQVVFDSIEFNKDISDSLFIKPVVKK